NRHVPLATAHRKLAQHDRRSLWRARSWHRPARLSARQRQDGNRRQRPPGRPISGKAVAALNGTRPATRQAGTARADRGAPNVQAALDSENRPSVKATFRERLVLTKL